MWNFLVTNLNNILRSIKKREKSSSSYVFENTQAHRVASLSSSSLRMSKNIHQDKI